MTLVLLLACRTDLVPPEVGTVVTDSGDTEVDGVDGCDALEVCNGVDDDCDGLVDDADDSLVAGWYVDADGDTFGEEAATLASCERPEGYANRAGDCDDGDALISPLADEVCNNGIDENCDGLDDCRLDGELDIQDIIAFRIRSPSDTNACHAHVFTDLDGDGVVDLLAGCGGDYGDEGAVFLQSGPLGEMGMDDADGVVRGEAHLNLGQALTASDWGWAASGGNSGVFLFSGPVSGEHLYDEGTEAFGLAINEGLGSAMDSAPDMLAVGAKYFSTDEMLYAGRVYAYPDVATFDVAEPAWWVEGEKEQAQFGKSVRVSDFNDDGHPDVGSQSSRGVALTFHDPTAAGLREPDVIISEATDLGGGDGLVVAMTQDVCVYFSPLSGTFEREDADACVLTETSEEERRFAEDPWFGDIDGTAGDLLFLSDRTAWLYRDVSGSRGRTSWEASAVLSTDVYWQFSGLTPAGDLDGDGLSELSTRLKSDFNGGVGDILVLGGATP